MEAGLFKQVDLSPSPTNTVRLNVFADDDKDLDISPDALEKHKSLAIEADKLYQSHHYDHYDFLLLLSSVGDGIGTKVLRMRQSARLPILDAQLGDARELNAGVRVKTSRAAFRRL